MTTRSEVLAMAKKCGAKEVLSYNRFSGPVVLRILDTELERFAALAFEAGRKAAEQDRERLDFIESRKCTVYSSHNVGANHWTVVDETKRQSRRGCVENTLREAIDRARSAK